jgi:hypothetical protein
VSEASDKPAAGLPRYLAPIGQPRDYVTPPAMSVHQEPECVSDAIVDSYASVAAFQHTLRHQRDVEAARETRPLLAAEDRLRDIHRRAKHSHVDLSHEIHIMKRDLEKARLQGKEAPVRVLTRLERIEGTLDGIAA